MSVEEVDEYLRGLEEPKRSTLLIVRRTILEIVPDAEQVISYRVPAFRVGGKTIAGLAAFKNHLSYLPFSGSVIEQLPNELHGYATTKSSVHTPSHLAVHVLISGVHGGSVRALEYARSLGIDDTRAVSFAFDDEEAARLERDWIKSGPLIPLDLSDAHTAILATRFSTTSVS